MSVLGHHHARIRRQRGARRATVVGIALGLALSGAAIAGCRQSQAPAPLRGDALLLASPQTYLERRLALVEGGELAAARRMWAERALILEPPPDDHTLLHDRSRQLAAAIDRFAAGTRDARAYYRLASSLNTARWHREALLAARRSVELDPEQKLESAHQLHGMLEHQDSFRAQIDSAASAIFARAGEGIVLEQRELPRFATTLASEFRYTFESLLAKGIYLGDAPSTVDDNVWQVSLAVVVGISPPRVVRRTDGEMRIRRVEIDHDPLPRYRDRDGAPWRARPGLVGSGGDLAVYHDVDFYRRTGVWMYRALERVGGAPPAVVSGVTPVAEAGVAPPVTSSVDWCVPGMADALRLHAAAPTFDRQRAAHAERGEALRRFVRALAEARMEQLETALARSYMDQLVYAELYGPSRLAERKFLEGLRLGPMPAWQLADLIDLGCDENDSDADAMAARSILRYLAKTLARSEPDAILGLTPEELRDAALTISVDRYGQ